MTRQAGKSLAPSCPFIQKCVFLVIFSFKDLWSKGLLKTPSLVNQLLLLQVLAVKKHRFPFQGFHCSLYHQYPTELQSILWILSNPLLGLVLVCYWCLPALVFPRTSWALFTAGRGISRRSQTAAMLEAAASACSASLSLKAFSAARAQVLGWWIRPPAILKRGFKD